MSIYSKTAMEAMPGSCTECKFGRRYGFVGDVKCRILNEYFTGNVTPPYKERPDDCPLIELNVPPNDPLTLSELREIEGKPVPVWCDKENGYIFIAATKTEPYNQVWYFNHRGFAHTVLYYSTKFYRRRPEEGTV